MSHTDLGSVEGANQLGKQYEGTQSREAYMGVQLQYHLSNLWVCNTVILGLGVPTNVLLQHIVLIAFIKYSNLQEKSYKHGTDIVYHCTM